MIRDNDHPSPERKVRWERGIQGALKKMNLFIQKYSLRLLYARFKIK
jgi:hypothetical protein